MNTQQRGKRVHLPTNTQLKLPVWEEQVGQKQRLEWALHCMGQIFRKQGEKGSNTHTTSGFPWFINSSTKPGAKEMQGFHTSTCSSQNEITAYNNTTKTSRSTSIMFMYRFAPEEQTVNSVNVTVTSSSTHVSNLISVNHCAGECDTQQSCSRRMRKSCNIGKEKKNHDSTSSCCS